MCPCQLIIKHNPFNLKRIIQEVTMYRILNDAPILLSDSAISISDVLRAIESTNQKLRSISDFTKSLSLDIFKVLDLRTLSGAVGETFVGEMSEIIPGLKKNPSIDGYPDLVQCVTPEMLTYYNSYASQDSKESFQFGGIEVKNTFGYKKSGIDLFDGEQRIDRINKRLEWKAHHQKTNHLLGLYSDYINGYPAIVAAFYSDCLSPDDWSVRAEPQGNSAMTSFSTLLTPGYKKMLSGIKICLDDPQYLQFFGQEV